MLLTHEVGETPRRHTVALRVEESYVSLAILRIYQHCGGPSSRLPYTQDRIQEELEELKVTTTAPYIQLFNILAVGPYWLSYRTSKWVRWDPSGCTRSLRRCELFSCHSRSSVRIHWRAQCDVDAQSRWTCSMSPASARESWRTRRRRVTSSSGVAAPSRGRYSSSSAVAGYRRRPDCDRRRGRHRPALAT